MEPKEALFEFAHCSIDNLFSWPIPSKERQQMKRLGYVICRKKIILGKKFRMWHLTEKGKELVKELLRDSGVDDSLFEESCEIEKEFRRRLKAVQ